MRNITPDEMARLLKAEPGYAADAYEFVGAALDFTVRARRKHGAARHVSGGELLEGLRQYALREYGPLALTVLRTWGIHACRDFGRVVFNMVNHRILGRSQEDSPADFEGGYDFERAFRAPFEPRAPRLARRKSAARHDAPGGLPA